MRVRGNVGLFAVLCLLPLTPACTSSTDKPSTLPSGSASVTTASPGISTSQAEAGRHIVDYYKAVDFAGTTGQRLTEPSRYYAPTCSVCKQIDERIREFVARGQHAVRGGHVIVVKGALTKAANDYTVTATVRTVPGALVDSHGKTVQSFPATGPYQWVYEVKSTSAGQLAIVNATNLGLPG